MARHPGWSADVSILAVAANVGVARTAIRDDRPDRGFDEASGTASIDATALVIVTGAAGPAGHDRIR